MCSKCGNSYESRGEVCSECSKLKNAGAANACSKCGILFRGSVDVCDKCNKSEDAKSGDGDPECDLAAHGVSSTMTEVSRKPQLRHITLQKLNGKRFELTFSEEFEPSRMSVAELVSEIQEHLAIPDNTQIRLVLDDVELQDEMSLVDSGIEDGSVLNLILVKNKNWLQVLQEEANSWTWDRQPNSCVELVPDDMHQKLLAGQSVSVIKVPIRNTQHCNTSSYRSSTVKHLLSDIEWLSKVLGEDDVEGIGRVWHARSDPKCAPHTNRQYNKYYVFELSGRAYQAFRYTTAF